MKTNTNITISTPEEAKNFLTELCKNNEHYNPDDSAHDIFCFDSEERLFTKEEADKLDRLMDSVFEVAYFDVYEFIIDFTIIDVRHEC